MRISFCFISKKLCPATVTLYVNDVSMIIHKMWCVKCERQLTPCHFQKRGILFKVFVLLHFLDENCDQPWSDQLHVDPLEGKWDRDTAWDAWWSIRETMWATSGKIIQINGLNRHRRRKQIFWNLMRYPLQKGEIEALFCKFFFHHFLDSACMRKSFIICNWYMCVEGVHQAFDLLTFNEYNSLGVEVLHYY